MLCFVKKALERMFHALVSHANAQAIRGGLTSKDDECFRIGSVHEFHTLKALKTLKEVSISDDWIKKRVHNEST